MGKFVVTGGAGFIGSHLVDKLILLGHKVIVIDNLSTGRVENINTFSDFYNIDISIDSNIDKITDIIIGSDAVFHLAANPNVQLSIFDPISSNKHNTDSTLNMLYSCYKANVKKLIFSSSSSVYGNTTNIPTYENSMLSPISPYALQKLIGEQYCSLFSKIYGLKTVSLRYFNVFGERQSNVGAYCSVISVFSKQKLENDLLTITNDGEQRRDFVYVGDVVDANIKAVLSDKLGDNDIINIGYGKNFSINEIASLFGNKVRYIGYRVEPKESLADIGVAKSLLGWQPRIDVVSWIKSNYQ